MKITVSAKEFQAFISANNNINHKGCTFIIKKNCIEALTLSEDNVSVVLFSTINILNPEDIKDEDLTGTVYNERTHKNEELTGEKRIFIKDLIKFQRLLDMNELDTFTFEIKNNYIYFKSTKVSGAKFFLGDENIAKASRKYSSKLFTMMKRDFKMTVNKAVIKQIIQASSFVSSTVAKVYFYENNGTILAEVNDKKLSDVDNLTIPIGTEFTGKLYGKAIIAMPSFSSLYLTDEVIIENALNGSVTNGTEIIFMTMQYEGVTLKYLLNSLKD